MTCEIGLGEINWTGHINFSHPHIPLFKCNAWLYFGIKEHFTETGKATKQNTTNKKQELLLFK
jgi:hypothetical protein